MKKILVIFSVLMSVILVGCGAGDNTTPEGTNSEPEQTEANDMKADKEDTNKTADVTLPDGFPADFPIPDEFTITKVKDKSNEKKITIQLILILIQL